MAVEHRITVPGHPSIYQFSQRDLNIIFCEPEQGINRETGLLLLIPNFGDSLDSEASVQMRNSFADTYNMVTIQCEYFGQKYMGTIRAPQFQFNMDAMRSILKLEEMERIFANGQVDLNALLEVGSRVPMNLVGYEKLDETPEHFNDMGIMQAIDHLSAIQIVSEIIKDNQYEYHQGKTIAFGSGHGAYLAYLSNAFAPGLFNLIIDHNGWLFPNYLESDRTLTFQSGLTTMSVVFQYLAKSMEMDKELLQLTSLYKKMINRCPIFAFHDSVDQTTPIKSKAAFCDSVNNCTFAEMTERDSIDLFQYAMSNISISFDPAAVPRLHTNVLNTRQFRYTIDFSTSVPVLTRQGKSG